MKYTIKNSVVTINKSFGLFSEGNYVLYMCYTYNV